MKVAENFGSLLARRLGPAFSVSTEQAEPRAIVSSRCDDSFGGDMEVSGDLGLGGIDLEDLYDLAYGGYGHGDFDRYSGFRARGLTDFGVDLSEIGDLVKSGDDRLTSLSTAFGNYSSTWAKKDPGGFADFLNDLTALQMRWGKAKAAAQSASSQAGSIATSLLTGGLSMGSGGQAAYDGLVKALKQGGEGARVQKGDFDDLASRLKAAGAKYDWTPSSQPGAPLTSSALKIVMPLDTLGMIKGDIAPQGPFAPPGGTVDDLRKLHDWWITHEHVIVLAMMAIGGIIFIGTVAGLIKAVKVGTPILVKAATSKVPLLAV